MTKPILTETERSRLLRIQNSRQPDWVSFPFNGICRPCGNDLIQDIDPKRLETEAITTCPRCHRGWT